MNYDYEVHLECIAEDDFVWIFHDEKKALDFAKDLCDGGSLGVFIRLSVKE